MLQIRDLSASRLVGMVIAVTPPEDLPDYNIAVDPDRAILYIHRRLVDLLVELAAAKGKLASHPDPRENHDMAERGAIESEPRSVWTWLRNPAIHLENA